VDLQRFHAVDVDTDVVVTHIVVWRSVIPIRIEFHRKHLVCGLPIVLIVDGAQRSTCIPLCGIVNAEQEHGTESDIALISVESKS